MESEGPIVLLVEGNATLRNTLRRYLDQRLPGRLIEATDAAQATALARSYQPDVILLDLSLPDQLGVAVISVLQSARPNVRIIAMASSVERLHAEAAERLGAWECISKEALGSQLESAVWRALPADGLSIESRLTRWQVTARASRLGLLHRQFAVGWDQLCQGIRWLDLNGPWMGRPRTRLLYLANIVELALVVAVQQHAIAL